jgi:ATP-dependent Clp protease ATP-binding subunit ClpE
VKDVLKDTFRPEFLNRLDETIIFTELSRDELKQIIGLMYEEVRSETQQKGLTLSFTDTVADFILEKGYDPKYGARPLRRTIQKYIEDELTDEFFQGRLKAGDKVIVDIENDAVSFRTE